MCAEVTILLVCLLCKVFMFAHAHNGHTHSYNCLQSLAHLRREIAEFKKQKSEEVTSFEEYKKEEIKNLK